MKIYDLDNWGKMFIYSEGDIYYFIMRIYKQLMRYGDKFILQLNNKLYEKIKNWDRDNIDIFHFRMPIVEYLRLHNIELKRIKTKGIGFIKIRER